MLKGVLPAGAVFPFDFGFVPSTEVGIEPPDPRWAEHFQVRTLTAFDPSTRGAFRYASPFDNV